MNSKQQQNEREAGGVSELLLFFIGISNTAPLIRVGRNVECLGALTPPHLSSLCVRVSLHLLALIILHYVSATDIRQSV